MNFKNRLKSRDPLITIGMASFLLGNVIHYFLHPAAPRAQDLVDGSFGLLYGVAIGCLLLSVSRHGRHHSQE